MAGRMPFVYNTDEMSAAKTNGGRVVVVLSRPESPENIGLAARAMKNTGFAELRLAGVRSVGPEAYRTAVHAAEILDSATFFPDAAAAVADCHVVYAATAKPRRNVAALSLAEAVGRISASSAGGRFGLLFGNERTGLTSDELLHANFLFTIPQAGRQPSYNLSAAVLLTLFSLFSADGTEPTAGRERPLPRMEQEAVIGLITEKLASKGFVHGTNAAHVRVLMHDLFGRLAMTDRDRRLLLAIFTKGVEKFSRGERNGG